MWLDLLGFGDHASVMFIYEFVLQFAQRACGVGGVHASLISKTGECLISGLHYL